MTDKIKIAINVLDDDSIILEFISQLFADDEHYEVSCFSIPDDFIAAFSKDIDLVITDIRIAGYDVIKAIKTISVINPTCYIVVMSAYFDVPMLKELIECRVDGVIEKTHEIKWLEELKDKVDALKPKLINKLGNYI